VTKQRYGIGPVRQDLVKSGLKEFASSAMLVRYQTLKLDPFLATFALGLRHFRADLCRQYDLDAREASRSCWPRDSAQPNRLDGSLSAVARSLR
jgi:hypothetical protein